jgi:arsenate reductase
VAGTDEEIEAAFERTWEIILARTQAFLALPLEELKNDRTKFKAQLDRIGTLLP